MQTCKYCRKEFIGKLKNHIYTFCSKTCSNRFNCKGKPCINRKEKIKRTGYWYIYMPKHPNSGKQGYIAEHRLIMEAHIGRLLTSEEVVHHKNEIITDNRIENLQLFSSHGQHTKLAHAEIYERQKVNFKGKRFSPRTEFKKGMIPWNKK